jgi:hypothetical protein
MKDRKAVAAVMSAEYKRARKKEKGAILARFIELTKYGRRYAARILREHGKKVRVGKTTIIGDVRKKGARKAHRIYDAAVVEALIMIWMIMDCICGKRLRAAMAEVIPVLKRNHEIGMSAGTEAKLLTISAATIDRLLATERKKQVVKGRSLTKPGAMLKHQIPIRTFSDWDDSKPGFVEIDLVGHEGGDARGDFCQTLDVTDVCTGWTETRAVRNKAQFWVFKALTHIRRNLPCPLLGIDSDNGGEFINHHLFRYCEQEHITFTRARPSRKNDNCFVEEKNNSVVRRNVGYRRYDTPEQLEVLNQLYDELRLYTNYFLPVMKLLRKERVGSKIKKVYDKPQTPYHRMLASPELSKAKKKILRQTYATLNPAQLKRNITSLQEKLVNLPAQGDKNRLKAHNVRRIDLPSRPVLRPNVRSNNQRRLA